LAFFDFERPSFNLTAQDALPIMELSIRPDQYLEEALRVLPSRFTERLRQIVPSGAFNNVLASFARPQGAGFRVNTLKADTASVVAELESLGLSLHQVPWKEDAFGVSPEQRAELLASAAFREQRIYVQNLSSMIPPLVLVPEPGERVLDLCAAPGSKTLQIACAMQNKGEIAAVELARGRFFKMRSILAAQGATSVRTFLKNGEHVWRNRPEYFDRVLLDAPCSTEGRFTSLDPETFAYWSPAKIKEMARKQQRLIYSAVQCLRPGGVLVYSTCTFAPEENELVLDRLLHQFEDALELEPMGLVLENVQPPLAAWQGETLAADLSHAGRILPTETMEGFFVCKIQKTRSTL
jgi:NOL1/NOP2/sun family putative RNA methylase